MVDWESFYNAFRVPDFVQGYEIQHRLGGGAFGEVYKARKLSIGKPYAIKFLKLDDQAEKEVIERELEQVRLFASIDHPNLVTIEDMGMVSEVPYLIMGYAGEETLARRLKQSPMERDAALRTFVQVCRGVLALHDRRLAHFDLKPGNVFLKGDVARVGDYGLAKLLVEGRSSLSFGRGTPHYMAPEMLRNRADHRADIYSLGVILYECLSGRVPYGADITGGMILRESDEPPDFPVAFPGPLRATVETCLRLSPSDRFDSVHELLEDMGQTARQGDSVRLPWKVPPLRDDDPGPKALPASKVDEPVTPTTGEGIRTAASELARGAVGVARGVWDGVTGKGEEEVTPRARPHGEEVVSVQTLADPDPDSVAPVPMRTASFLDEIAPPVTRRPFSDDGVGAVTVPVPPRDEGGVVGTMTTAVVLGAEILGAILTGPVGAVLRGIRLAIDRLVHGLPGVLGAGVRLVLFMLLCMGLGAVATLVFMGALMGGRLYIR